MKHGRMFTKDEISTVLSLWETRTVAEIAQETDRPLGSIHYLAAKIRKQGYNLPKKMIKNKISNLIQEVLKEKNLI